MVAQVLLHTISTFYYWIHLISKHDVSVAVEVCAGRPCPPSPSRDLLELSTTGRYKHKGIHSGFSTFREAHKVYDQALPSLTAAREEEFPVEIWRICGRSEQ
jgi:hypothetical protein